MLKFTVRDENNRRVDSFVVTQLTNLSRSFVHKLVKQHKIFVNKKPQKAGYRIKSGDTVEIDYDISKLHQIPSIELPILYEDEDCVVMNKPAGVLTHSKGAFNPEATVATFLKQKITPPNPEFAGSDPAKGVNGRDERAGIVHRLDRATSGVIIGAKNPEALLWLQKQFSRQQGVKKTYIAVVEGSIDPKKAIIDMPIERNPKKPQTFRVGVNGKPSKTAYEVIRSSGEYSLLELRPETGRTHQLRVHLKQLKHPIVGDTLYGGKQAPRLYLHALSLEITLPNRLRKVFIAPLPLEFNNLLED